MIETLKCALAAANLNERHQTIAESYYWLRQYKLLAEKAIAELESQEPFGIWHQGATDEEITVGDQAIAALNARLAQPEQTEVQQLIALVRAQQITIDKLEMALADHHMREVQRLGQEIEQEPICPACKAEVLYECVACSSNNYPQKENT